MALFDFLTRKKEIEKARKGKKIEKKPTKKVEENLVKKTPATVKATVGDAKKEINKTKIVKSGTFFYEAVKQPHISEKASYLAEKNQYTFKVSPNHNKKEIKNAVEGLYGVDVLSVKVIKIPAKKRRIGKTQGFRKGYKKAIVKIREDQKIEIL
jgi:large subunit ribosomal protein L23